MLETSRGLRALVALLVYSSVHWTLGRRRRALAWDALLLVALLAIFAVGPWLLVVLWLAQTFDATRLAPAVRRSPGGSARLVAAVAVALLAGGALAGRFWVASFPITDNLMAPALQRGDYVLVDRATRTPRRGDVMAMTTANGSGIYLSRVLALPGDKLEVRDDAVFVNDQPLQSVPASGRCEQEALDRELHWRAFACNAFDETNGAHTYRTIYLGGRTEGRRNIKPVILLPGEMFLAGDDRDLSQQTIYAGMTPIARIRGRARTVWWSHGPAGIFGRRIP